MQTLQKLRQPHWTDHLSSEPLTLRVRVGLGTSLVALAPRCSGSASWPELKPRLVILRNLKPGKYMLGLTSNTP